MTQNRFLLAIGGLFIVSIANAEMPKSPDSFNKSNKEVSNNKDFSSNAITEEKVMLALPEEVKVIGTRPIAVKLYDKNFIEEVNNELKKNKKNSQLKANEVILKGVVSKVKNDKGEALKVAWNQVANEDETKTSSISIPLKSLFLSSDGVIPSATKISAYGDKEELKRAIMNLATVAPAINEPKINIDPQAKTKNKSASNSFNPNSGGSGTNGNEKVDLNRTPINYPLEPNATYSTTTEGCSPRVDWVSEKVYPTAAQVKHVNNTEERIGECMDSNIPYDIKYNYLECEAIVKLEERIVLPYKKAYYINEAGEIAIIKDCFADEEKQYIIEEEKGLCNDIVDFNKNTATEQVTLAYRNIANNRIVIQQCAISKNARIFELKNTICGHTPDFENETVIVKTQKTYEKDGATLKTSNCVESEEKAKLLWDTTSCNSQIDYENMTFVELARPMVKVDGKDEYLGVCMPKTNSDNVLTDTTGCESEHYDYLTDGYSNGFVKYYQLINNKKKYLTGCVEYPKNQYTHKKEIVSYLHEDKYFRSWPQYRTYIELPYPAEKTYITNAETDTTVSIPYKTVGVKTVGINEFVNEGCQKFEKMQKVQAFERADKTEHHLTVEDVAPKLLGDVCVLTTQSIDRYYQETLYYDELGGKGITNVTPRGDCLYQYWTQYWGNSYGSAYKRSYTPYQISTEIRIKTNPETNKEFREEGLTVATPVACPGNNNQTSFCLTPADANGWTDGRVVTCRPK